MTHEQNPGQGDDGFVHPMSAEIFRQQGHALIDWIADYLEGGVDQHPVMSRVRPGEIRESLAPTLPEEGEPWDAIWRDFEEMILPGITHWQSPSFHAYFPANVSYPGILGELLSAGLGINGMLWATSPAATELETHLLDLLVDAMGLPQSFKGGGVIQDTASNASLCAILCGREQALRWESNQFGLSQQSPLAVYTSNQAHSSIEKGAKIAGIGRSYVRLISTDDRFAMRPDMLEQAIQKDLSVGIRPAMISATIGTTSSLAIDPIRAIGEVAREYGIWLHVDAAMAGSAFLCPEYRHLADGLELADSFCFNPHKWLLTNFDLDVFYVRDPARLVRTLSIMPEYLRTDNAGEVVNYRDWHVQLGRRFRALKLWFVLRTYGLSGLRSFLRRHIDLAKWFEEQVVRDERFELVTPRQLNLVCFRLIGSSAQNEALLRRINERGNAYLTHTKLRDIYALRMCIGQTNTGLEHVKKAWREISYCANALPSDSDASGTSRSE